MCFHNVGLISWGFFCLVFWRVREEVAEARMEMGNCFASLAALAETGDIPGRWRCELRVLSWKSLTSCSYGGVKPSNTSYKDHKELDLTGGTITCGQGETSELSRNISVWYFLSSSMGKSRAFKRKLNPVVIQTRPNPCFVLCDRSIRTLPNAQTQEMWGLLHCTHPIPVFTHPCLHQCQKVGSMRTTLLLM